jgi:hypothetical protein
MRLPLRHKDTKIHKEKISFNIHLVGPGVLVPLWQRNNYFGFLNSQIIKFSNYQII